MLCDDTTTKFREALREHCSDADIARESVKAATRMAASEARRTGMSAEQFVIWVKQVWDEIATEGRLVHNADPSHARDVLISSAIKAYYVQ